MTPKIEHCLVKIFEIVAKGDGGRRSVFQLGYNLGQLVHHFAQAGRHLRHVAVALSSRQPTALHFRGQFW